MKLLGSISIKHKIVIGITAVSSIILICSCLVLTTIVTKKSEQNLSNDGATLAKIVAANSTGALSFADVDSAQESLRTLQFHPNVEKAILYDEEGNRFALFAKPGAESDAGWPDKGSVGTEDGRYISHYDGKQLHVMAPVISDDEAIGRIYIQFNNKSLMETQQSFVYISIFVILVGVVVSLTLAVFTQKSILLPVARVMNALKDIAEGEGDLTQRLDDSSNDIIGELAHWFNSFVIKVHKVVMEVSGGTEKLSGSAEILSNTTAKTSKGVVHQQKEINSIVDSMTLLTSAVEAVSRDIDRAADEARVMDEKSSASKEVVGKTRNAIEKLAEEIEDAAELINELDQQSEKIGAVLKVIGDIADQTNLLALNAAIEAARAGEQGRGFAVVADEVRSLAGRTQSSTKEIDTIIAELKNKVGDAVSVMQEGKTQARTSVGYAENASGSIDEISTAISAIRSVTDGVFEASNEQNKLAEAIQSSIQNISKVANQTSSDAESIYQGSVELNSLSTSLEKIVNQFKV